MIYELRIYHCVTGRLPALLKRFENTTLELWKRHGIRQAGFWTVMVGDGGNQDLHYLLAWESLAEREAKWNKFASDSGIHNHIRRLWIPGSLAALAPRNDGETT
jgi:hypothetical protein